MSIGKAPAYLGLDLGTSGVKALAVDRHARVLAVAQESYVTRRSRLGWAEQSPDDWWRASTAALHRLIASPELRVSTFESLGLSGQMHGAVVLDRERMPLRDAIIWSDARGGAELDHLAAHLPNTQLAALTGSAPYASSTLAKLLWLREHEPETFAQTSHVLLAKDELRRRFVGTLATDPSDASGTLLYDISTRAWSSAVLAATRLDAAVLPEVLPSDAVAGYVTEQAAAYTGLMAGLPVATGGGDAACAALGAGIGADPDGARTGLLSVGTAGQIAVLNDAPVADPRVQTFAAVADGKSLVIGAILAGGFALEWLARATGAASVRALLDDARELPPGSDGLLFIPHLNGTRSPRPDLVARGAFVGLDAAHGRAHLARAAVEGVAFALRCCVDALREMGLAPDVLVGAGGPLLHPLWQQTLADVLRCPLRVTWREHLSALGAALLGTRAVGAWPADASSPHDLAQRIEPNEAQAVRYDRLYEIYRNVDAALRQTSLRLADFHAPADTA